MPKWIIQDWTGRVIDHFKMTVAYKFTMDILPTEFDSFDDAEYFLSIVLDNHYETDRQKYYIVEKEEA